MEQLVANLAGKIRYETLNGRRHLVAPLSMLVPGVLNGSKGPLLYPPEEVGLNHDAWNIMPMVVNHPTDEKGKAVSARSPKVLEQFGVGTVFNAGFNGKLAAEGWFDEEKSIQLIPKQYERLQRGDQIELSTGLFTDNHPVKNGRAVHDDGKTYVAVARNYRPDHLAILTDTKGACSIRDGCGVNVNQAIPVDSEEPTEEQLEQYVDWDELSHNQSLSHSDVRERLNKLLRERNGRRCDVVDVFDKVVVYTSPSMDYDSPPKYYELGYTSAKGKVSLLDGPPTEVMREVSYSPVANSKPWYELLPNSSFTANCDESGECTACEKKRLKKETEQATNALPSKSADVSVAKACQILKDGAVNDKPLTKKQRGMFGAICGVSRRA